MRAPIVLLVLASLSTFGSITSCASSKTSRSTTRAEADEYHVQAPREDIRAVMQAKLSHAHALLESIALEDFEQIERNAVRLADLGGEAGWHVHGTSAYEMFSTQFRETVERMAADARARNLDAVTNDYGRMARTCVSCHSYLRSQGLVPESDVPISAAPRWSPAPL